MKSYCEIALKEMKVQKFTSLLIIIAIILSNIMTTVIGQSIGILNAMRTQQAIALNGNRYATFHQVNGKIAEQFKTDESFSFTGAFTTLGFSKLGNSGLTLCLREYHENALSAYTDYYQLDEGTLPKKSNEIALTCNTIELLGENIKIGDEISLPMEVSLLKDTEEPYEYTEKFILTGIIKSNYISYVSGTIDGIAGEGTAEKILPYRYRVFSVDVRTKSKLGFQTVISTAEKKYNIPDSRVQYNDTLLSVMNINYNSTAEGNFGSGFSYMTLAGIVIGFLVLMAAGLVVYNIFKISVNKKIKQYGILRAIGSTKGKLYKIVILQLIVLCAIGIPIGSVLGVFFSKEITLAATKFFAPEMFMSDSQNQVKELVNANSGWNISAFLVSVLITLVFTIAAAFPAAHMATKVSPAIAISTNTVKIKRRNKKIKKIYNFESFYARMNMCRNKGRTALTILSLVMSITVFIALHGFARLLDASASIQKMHLGDYVLTNEESGFSPDEVEKLQNLDEIKNIITLKYKLYDLDEDSIPQGISTNIKMNPGETFQVCGIGENQIKQIVPEISMSELEKIKTGKGCIVKNPIALGYNYEEMEQTLYEKGDTILINDNKMEILFITDDAITLDNGGFVNGIQIIVYDTIYNLLTEDANYTELYPVLSENADKTMVESKIGQICTETPGSQWLSYKETDNQLEESYAQIKLLAWGIIVFIGLIGILNIINTVYTNIHTRTGEIGIQRAVGMNMKSFYKTFLWEGAYYGIIATIIGLISGYICTIFVDAAANDYLQLVIFPVIPALEAAFISISTCLAASSLPLIKISKMSIVECIDTVE